MDDVEAYKNLFMMCQSVDENAYSELSDDFYVRPCREDELSLWKNLHFDKPEDAKKYLHTIDTYFQETYAGKEDLFFEKNVFVCDKNDTPIGTCFIWKSYDEFNTVQWLKVIKGFENRGIGRALLSLLLKDLTKDDFPVYLSTQTRNFRAIKLYTDFGFCLLTDEYIGKRKNDLKEALPILKDYMDNKAYQKLQKCKAPTYFISKLKQVTTVEF